MTKTFKPLLAGKVPEDLAQIKYPVLVSPKLDGIRCIIRDGVAMSRALKPIPNERVREALASLPHGIDGELMVEGGFNACQSFFMSRKPEEWTDDWWFFAFDWLQGDNTNGSAFAERLEALTLWSEEHGHNNLHVVEHVLIEQPCPADPHLGIPGRTLEGCAEELKALMLTAVDEGFEGIMVRDPAAGYKFGRSTTKQGILLKLKAFADEEATIIGLEELMSNENKLEEDELGYAKRSTHKAGKVPMGTLGSFKLRFDDGAEFNCGGGPGLTQELRQELWDTLRPIIESPEYGKLSGRPTFRATIRYQPDPGGRKPGQKPRIPQFHGIRHPDDS